MAQERRRFRRGLIAGAVVLGLGAIGTVGAVQAHGAFNGMWGGHGPGFGRPMAGQMVERTLEAVDATEAQRGEIREIVDAARREIRRMVAGLDHPREQFTTLLAAETVDRAAFETLRQQMLEAGDAVSKRAMAAFLDIAEVLTPEQRAELVAQRHGFRPGFGR